MKTICLCVCGLAGAAALVQADQDNDRGNKGGGNGKGAPVQQQVQVAPKTHIAPNQGFYRDRRFPQGTLPGTQNLNGNVNQNLRNRVDLNGRVIGRTHQQFHVSNTPNPNIASARFNPNHHIEGSDRWGGHNYSAFRNYHSQWHDHNWWRQHHNRIILIGGGWYFWDAGFWCPAWGYDSAYAYYPYDGPIYAYNDLPPDQVIANVQAALQEQGYYDGEVDGVLGPLTRAALADYQRDHGLYTTAAIDQPTLASLGME